jgi:hypothetical protein
MHHRQEEGANLPLSPHVPQRRLSRHLPSVIAFIADPASLFHHEAYPFRSDVEARNRYIF